jgi:hypothetical protein
VDEVGDIVVNEGESVPTEVAFDVVERTGDEVVHADDLEALIQETPTQMRTEETRTTGHKSSFGSTHDTSVLAFKYSCRLEF